jgi:hypothetical protein
MIILSKRCTILSGEIERRNANAAEHATRDAFCKNDLKKLKSVCPLWGEVERTSETLSSIIEQDDERLYFIDLSFNIINLTDDDDHEAMQLISNSEKNVDVTTSNLSEERR